MEERIANNLAMATPAGLAAPTGHAAALSGVLKSNLTLNFHL